MSSSINQLKPPTPLGIYIEVLTIPVSNLTKRQQEKLTSRECLAKSLSNFKEKISAKDLLNPETYQFFQKTYLMSLSHSNQYATATVCSKDKYKYLGIDIENFSRATRTGFQERIAIPQEINDLRSLDYTDQQLNILIFSIKEACYKATSTLTPQFTYQNYQIILEDKKIKVKVFNNQNLITKLSCEFSIIKNQIITLAYLIND